MKYNYIFNIYSYAYEDGLCLKPIFFFDKECNENQFINKHSVMMEICETLSQLSHCRSIKVASLIVKDWRIISTGINGTPSGMINCDEYFKENFDRQEHHEWSTNNELHSEQNAIAIAAKNGININESTMYLTLAPCINCAKLIAASGIKNLIFSSFYDFNYSAEWYKILKSSKVNIYKMSINKEF